MRDRHTEGPYPRTELGAWGMASNLIRPVAEPTEPDRARSERTVEAGIPDTASRGQIALRWFVIALLLGLIGLALVAPAPYGGYTPGPGLTGD